MADWRDIILKEFPRQVAKLTLVADPDGLLAEEGILRALQERGFDLIPFDDSIAFRYAYEFRYRRQWDQGKSTDLVVVLRSPEQDLENLPFDLYTAGRKISFDLTDVFPNLSYPVVDELDRSHFETLYQAQQQEKPRRLGSNQTRDFMLLHVFELQPKLIKQPAHLLRELIRLHYRGIELPVSLARRVVEVLGQCAAFSDWPLDKIIPERTAFYAFLQERWEIFVRRSENTEPAQTSEGRGDYGLRIPGPDDLPFEHDDVRVYLDNLFAEGILEPVDGAGVASVTDWMRPGIATGEGALDPRIEKLAADLASSLPATDAKYVEWLRYASRLAELTYRLHAQSGHAGNTAADTIPASTQIEDRFTAWALSHYGALFNQPPSPPVMVHHIPRHLSSLLDNDSSARLAFILVDGLSLSQWAVLRQSLRGACRGIQFDERAVFAWVPTLTCLSRQAAFSAKIPQYFPDSIEKTSKDEQGWRHFWADRGISGEQVGFIAGSDNTLSDGLERMADSDALKVLGVTVYTVDEVMHGVKLGMPGMFGQVQQWSRQGLIAGTIVSLLGRGFRVFLGSDHGNTEAVGIGVPAEGAIADSRGQRVRVYPDAELRDVIGKEYPDAISWPSLGLPPEYFPLLAPNGKAFTQNGSTVVTHGGLSIEEVIVPFVEISGVRP